MSAKRNSTRARNRGRKTTERPLTVDQHRSVEQLLISQGQSRAVKGGYFCMGTDRLPIAGTPRPVECPFCGKLDDIFVVVNENCAHVECGVCGAEAPRASTNEDDITDIYAAILRAAARWNDRGNKS